jgi:RNA polymerase sigma factor (sigma-70 family)
MVPITAADMARAGRVARSTGRRYAGRVRASAVSNDDLVAAGTLGLVQAAQRCEPGRPLWGLASSRVRGEVVDELRRHLWGSRTRPANRPEVLDVGLPAPATDDTATEALARVSDACLTRLRAALPERMRQVLTLHYEGGLTLAQIGARLGVTESRACQIHTEAIRNLRDRYLHMGRLE